VNNTQSALSMQIKKNIKTLSGEFGSKKLKKKKKSPYFVRQHWSCRWKRKHEIN
jgi:hypothetical protein